MFRDTKEELDRLEAELLSEDEEEEIYEDAGEEPEELLDENQLDSLLQDTQRIGPVDGTVIYKNYSNGYKAYNSDKTDLDPEELSQEILKPQRDPVVTGLTALALFLLVAILGVLAYVLLSFWGIL